jgi:DNA-binding NtrC family response regulator
MRFRPQYYPSVFGIRDLEFNVPGHILIVDDDANLGGLLVDGLKQRGFDAVHVSGAVEARERATLEEFDTIITDINMPGMGGLELCQLMGENRPDIPVIMMTAYGSFDAAVSAIRSGAYDFITKPFDLDIVAVAIERAVAHRRLRDEVRRLRMVVSESQHRDDVIGSSQAMREIFELLSRLSDSDATVLVSGESGTGKEIVARALHKNSRRSQGPFVAVNCAAVPENLLESELFGHVRGAFTDAKTARVGLFAQANGGALFLDEIGDMPLTMQPKLLRAIEERTIRPVGGNQDIHFDVRIIAATHRDLESIVETGQFRQDLYYRINVVHVALPPLRARGGDVLQLAQVFLERCATRAAKDVRGIGAKAADKLLSYEWPGNVRELRNVMERAVALTRYDTLAVEDLPEKIGNHQERDVIVAGSDPTELVTLEEVEQRYVAKVMLAVGGNKTLAAHILGLDRKTLYRRLNIRTDSSSVRPPPRKQDA